MSQPQSRRLPLATGLTYHLLEWGAENAALDHTVVLVHGFLDLAWSWEEVVAAGLDGSFHVIAPDMRGHGDSDWVGAGGYYHFFDYLADLHEVIRLTARARVSLVGHSMGGSIASYYSGTYPERVHRLALLEGMGPPEGEDTNPQRVASWIAEWQKARARPPRSYASLDEAAERLRANDPLLDAQRARRLAEHGTTRTDGDRLRFKHDPLHVTMGPIAFRLEMAKRFWQRIACPVLVVDGSESVFRLSAEDTRRRRAALGQLEEAVLEGAGHMMQRHQPVTLARLLGRFLSA